MDTYVILRRGAWGSADELGQAAERSRTVGDGEMSQDIRWIRSYVLDEGDGRVGTVSATGITSSTANSARAACSWIASGLLA